VLAPSNPVSILIKGIGPPQDNNDHDAFATWEGTSFAAAQISGAIAARTVPGRVSARQAWSDIMSAGMQADAAAFGPRTPFYLALPPAQLQP
jgi:hypothetical protein